MPITKKQDKRIEILDELLAAGEWTAEQLLSKINRRIADSVDPINKRTLFRDIKYLIEEKNAPIHRPERGDNRYYYEEKFSLKNLPLDEDDLASLKNAIEILKQVGNFALLQEVDYVIRKLENRINVDSTDAHIHVQFERHTSAQGTEYISELLEAIKNKNTLRITYQPYTHPEASERIVHPYLLKEFRNRWFLIGREGDAKRITNYALDRIKKIRPSNQDFITNDLFDPKEYFSNLIGVSVPENARLENVEIKVYKPAKPYILSKPIHLSQEIIKENKDGTMLIRLNLILNYELKSVLQSYGDGIEIKKPKGLRAEMISLAENVLNRYIK